MKLYFLWLGRCQVEPLHAEWCAKEPEKSLQWRSEARWLCWYRSEVGMTSLPRGPCVSIIQGVPLPSSHSETCEIRTPMGQADNVPISKVSLFQGMYSNENCNLGTNEVSFIHRMSSFHRVAIHRFHYVMDFTGCPHFAGLLFTGFTVCDWFHRMSSFRRFHCMWLISQDVLISQGCYSQASLYVVILCVTWLNKICILVFWIK
jgi:hypothetical protein